MTDRDHHACDRVPGAVRRAVALCLATVWFLFSLPGWSAETNEEVPSPPADSAPLALTLGEAALLALEQNVLFRIERLDPETREQVEEIERAAFDPVVTGATSYENVGTGRDRDTFTLEGGIARFFSTGTTAALAAQYDDVSEDGLDTEAASWDVTVTQALLSGSSRQANLARVHQARIDTRISRHDLRAVAELLVAAVEKAYWDCVLAQEKINIYMRSLEVAEQQIREVREQVDIGRVAELELAAAEAEVAEKREELIGARGDLAKRQLAFRRLLTPGSDNGWWTRPLVFRDEPEPIAGQLDTVEHHVALGLRNRPELAQARLLIERGELEIVRTRDGLLPRLDLFLRLGGTHYCNAFAPSAAHDDDYQAAIGLELSFPIGLREEHARHRIAQIDRNRQELALKNLRLLLQMDVRSAYVDVDVATEQIVATRATSKLRQDTLTAEQEKFRVGTSTTLQVAQAWRDLLASQINEVEAVVTQRKALVELYRLDASLLERRGIDMR